MIGAYAGEIGQTQFLPSSYIKYGVDFDGDGHVDLRHSVPDVLASTANLLHVSGFKMGEPYGEGTANFEAMREWNSAMIYRKTIGYFADSWWGGDFVSGALARVRMRIGMRGKSTAGAGDPGPITTDHVVRGWGSLFNNASLLRVRPSTGRRASGGGMPASLPRSPPSSRPARQHRPVRRRPEPLQQIHEAARRCRSGCAAGSSRCP